MAVEIRVVDRDGKPVDRARVHVSWAGGGSSTRYTGKDGLANLETSSGTATEILVNGTKVDGGVWLDHGIHKVVKPN